MAGHGHVTPNPDGSKARCGGPAICPVCAKEAGARMSIIQEVAMRSPNPTILTCPFCGQDNFDAAGLKSHLSHGDCDLFNSIETLKRF